MINKISIQFPSLRQDFKKTCASLFLLTLFFTVVGVKATAQFNKAKRDSIKQSIEKNLKLEGTVLKDGLPLEGAEIIVRVNDRVEKSRDTTKQDGTFQVEMPFGYEFVLEFANAGFVSKKLAVSTTGIPKADREVGYETAGFKVELFPKVPDFDFSVYNEPVGRIAYDMAYRQFTYDRKYIKKKKKELEPIEEAVAEVLVEFEREQEKLNEQYDLLVRDADIEFEALDYELASQYYEEALKIKPEAQYPKDRLQEIQKIDSRKQLTIDENYQAYIQTADSALTEKNWEMARRNYVEALGVKPSEEYPKEQIQKVSKIIDDLVKKEKQLAQENRSSEPQETKTYSLANVFIPQEKQRYALEIARKYPQGLTEETERVGNRTVYKRIIVEGNKGVEFKKVTHDWGGTYFFKNGDSISQFKWNKEAIQ